MSPGDENDSVKIPPALPTFIPVKVATPDEAVADPATSDAFCEPDAIVAVTTAALVVTVLPDASTTLTTGTVPKVAPGNTPPTG